MSRAVRLTAVVFVAVLAVVASLRACRTAPRDHPIAVSVGSAERTPPTPSIRKASVAAEPKIALADADGPDDRVGPCEVRGRLEPARAGVRGFVRIDDRIVAEFGAQEVAFVLEYRGHAPGRTFLEVFGPEVRRVIRPLPKPVWDVGTILVEDWLTYRGRVSTTDAEAVPGALVQLLGPGNESPGWCRTGLDGRFALSVKGLYRPAPAGADGSIAGTRVVVSAAGFEERSTPAREDGFREGHEIGLERGSGPRIKVTALGAPMVSARVSFLQVDTGGSRHLPREFHLGVTDGSGTCAPNWPVDIADALVRIVPCAAAAPAEPVEVWAIVNRADASAPGGADVDLARAFRFSTRVVSPEGSAPLGGAGMSLRMRLSAKIAADAHGQTDASGVARWALVLPADAPPMLSAWELVGSIAGARVVHARGTWSPQLRPAQGAELKLEVGSSPNPPCWIVVCGPRELTENVRDVTLFASWPDCVCRGIGFSELDERMERYDDAGNRIWRVHLDPDPTVASPPKGFEPVVQLVARIEGAGSRSVVVPWQELLASRATRPVRVDLGAASAPLNVAVSVVAAGQLHRAGLLCIWRQVTRSGDEWIASGTCAIGAQGTAALTIAGVESSLEIAVVSSVSGPAGAVVIPVSGTSPTAVEVRIGTPRELNRVFEAEHGRTLAGITAVLVPRTRALQTVQCVVEDHVVRSPPAALEAYDLVIRGRAAESNGEKYSFRGPATGAPDVTAILYPSMVH